jgi:exonuclease VII small subunit
MTNPLERYLSALDHFNRSVAELAAKYEEANEAREAALQASAELRHELEATDQRVQDLSLAVQHEMARDFSAKRPMQSATLPAMSVSARAS